MRADDFINEKINDAIVDYNFYAEKFIELPEVGKLKLVAKNLQKDRPPQFKIDVINSQGDKIGYFRFIVIDYEPETRLKLFARKTDPYVIGGNVSVWREHQRKGIARAVYNWIRSMGNDIRPSPTQTDAGRAMWRSFDRELINEVTIGPDDLVDVFIRGKHRGEPFTRLVARGFPNKHIPLLLHRLETKYNINPNAVIYGPSRIKNENFASSRKFVEPNFDVEWEEAERYPEFVKLGKDAWIELARKGRAVTITSARGISNTDAADPDSFKSLVPAKQKRAIAQLEKGTVEMPIVAVYSDGRKELIGGNTRLTAMMANDGQATVWAFQVPGRHGMTENFADGKIKGRSRPGRVQRAGASCKGSVLDLRARAKKYGGERGRMYHWCANMKAGKQK